MQLPYNFVVPVREDQVGVRLALTWIKLRAGEQRVKSPGHWVTAGQTPWWQEVRAPITNLFARITRM